MGNYYFDSDKIQVFPCANRGGEDPASKFTTEYNLTHLGGLRTEIISNSLMSQYQDEQVNKTRLVQCWVSGYYFKFILNPDWVTDTDNGPIYLQIKLSDTTTNSSESLTTAVANQGKLIPFEGDTLDRGGKFYGARVTTATSTNASNVLVLRSGTTWQTAIPSYLRLRGDDGKIYRIKIGGPGSVIAIQE